MRSALPPHIIMSQVNTIKIKARCGDHISKAAQLTIEIAKEKGCNVEFDFNDILVTATPNSTCEELCEYYQQKSDERYNAWVNSPEYAKLQAKREIEARELEDVRAVALTELPDLELTDQNFWDVTLAANQDGMGKAIFDFAERWARLMQKQMSAGQKLEDIADDCITLADTDGISGSMLGMAKQLLVQTWKYGPELKNIP